MKWDFSIRRLLIIFVILNVVAAVIVHFSLPQAIPASRGGGPAAIEPAGKIELTFWHIQNYSPTKEVIEDAVKRFHRDHPRVKIKVAAYENNTFKTVLNNALRAGKAPDIFHTWGGGVLKERYDAGLVRDLSTLYADARFKARFVPAALPFAYLGGKPLLVPADLSLVLFFYNKKLFQEHGLKPPNSIEGLKQVCAKLREQGIEPITLGNMKKWPGCFYYIYGVIRAGGREPAQKAAALEEGAFLHEAFTQGGATVKELVDADCFSAGFQGMDYMASRQLLFTGKAGMTLMGTWLIANAQKEAVPEMRANLGCFPYPPGREGGNAVVGGINCAFAVSSKCRQPEAAEKFLRYLSDTSFAAQWAKTGRIPAVKGARPEDFTPLTREAFATLEQADFIQMYFDQLFPAGLGEKHKETCQALFSGKATPAEVSQALEAEAARLRQK